MNPDTKAIAVFETDDDAKRAGYTVSLTEDEERHLSSVPRDQRKAALATFRGSPVLTRKYIPQRRTRDSK